MGSSAINYQGSAGGRVVQMVNVMDSAYVNYGAQTIPKENTKPQNNEGAELMSLAITPTNAANVLRVDVVAYATLTGGASTLTAALFRDDIVDAVSTGGYYEAGGIMESANFSYFVVPSGVVETTFKLRAGGSGGETLYFNGDNGQPRYDETLASSMTITEIGPGIGGGDTPTYQ